jgi:hypothetical protein
VAFVGSEKPEDLAPDTDCSNIETPRSGGGKRTAAKVQYAGSDNEGAQFWIGSGDIYRCVCVCWNTG